MTEPKRINEILYFLSLKSNHPFLDKEFFKKFIKATILETKVLEGRFSFDDRGRFGDQLMIDRNYHVLPSDRIIYAEEGNYDSRPSQDEVFNDMESNLKFFSEGYNVSVDKSGHFSISGKD